MNTQEQINQAKQILKDAGYQTENLWHIDDVKSRYNCTDEQAHEILHKAITNEATMGQIWLSIDSEADFEELEPVFTF